MKHLTALDQGFLEMENPENPLHVGIVQVYNIKHVDKPSFIEKTKRYFLNQIAQQAPFFQKLKKAALGGFDWHDQPHLDESYHIEHHSLPGATVDEVMGVVAKTHEQMMNRDYPLWRLVVFEGLKDDKLAVYFKVHHACIDGVGGMRLSQSFLSSDPAVIQEINAKRPGAHEQKFSLENLNIFNFFKRAQKIVSEEIDALKEMATSFIDDWRNHEKEEDHLLPLPFSAPKTLINRPTSARRSLKVRTYKVDSFKKARRAFKATVNDLVLAQSAGALRRYLAYHNALPEKPMVAFIPVSVRSSHAKSDGNEIGFILVNMATHLEDAAARIRTISASTSKGKEQLSHMSKDAVRRHAEAFFALGSLGGVNQALNYLPPMFNLVISNIPASRRPLYLDGAPLEAVYPVSVLFTAQALNITLMNYAGNLDFGLIACPEVIPDLERLASYFDESYDEIMSLV